MLAVFGIGQWELILLVVLSTGCVMFLGFVGLVLVVVSKRQ